MNNSTEESVTAYLTTGLGITYILTGVIVIPLHIVCSWLMLNDKEMRNPTYQFIINLSIADVLELIIICIYAGIMLLFRIPYDPTTPLSRITQWLCLGFWYINGVLFALIAFSRWIAMTRNHLVQHVFTKTRLYLMHTLPWIILLGFYLYALGLYPIPTFVFYPEIFTWGFDMTVPFAEFLHWFNFSFNTCCTFFEMVFNIMSLRWVHKTRKTIQNLASSENRRREVKLLVQCFIIGCVYTLTHVMFTIVGATKVEHPAWFVVMQFVWTSNHCVNPIVYLSVNTKLRLALIRLVTRGKFGHPKKKQKAGTFVGTGGIPGGSVGGATSMVSRSNRVGPEIQVRHG